MEKSSENFERSFESNVNLLCPRHKKIQIQGQNKLFDLIMDKTKILLILIINLGPIKGFNKAQRINYTFNLSN